MNDHEPLDLLAGLRTGTWLDAQVFPPLTWFVPGVLPEGMSLLIGGPKIGKSWLALNIALAVASGGRALGQIPVGRPRPVLLLALEDGDRRMQHRCRELLRGEPIPAGLQYMTRIEPGQAMATIQAWLGGLHNLADPLVLLDTLGKCTPRTLPGETDYQRDYRFAGGLKRLCDDRPGMALLALHHDRKAESADFVDSVSGTNGIAGAADSVLVLNRKRTEDDGLLQATGRDIEEREYAMQVTGGHWRLAGDSLAAAADAATQIKVTAGLGDRSTEVVRYVTEHPDGVRAADVAEALDMSSDDAGRYLRRLRDAGRIVSPTRGAFRPPPVRSVRLSESGEPLPPNGHTDTTDRGCPDTKCAVCGFPVHAALAAAGETTHPSCETETGA